MFFEPFPLLRCPTYGRMTTIVSGYTVGNPDRFLLQITPSNVAVVASFCKLVKHFNIAILTWSRGNVFVLYQCRSNNI